MLLHSAQTLALEMKEGLRSIRKRDTGCRTLSLFLDYEHIYIYKYALEACVLKQITTLTKDMRAGLSPTLAIITTTLLTAPVFPKPDTNPQPTSMLF